jgi:DNA gyrase/topoisomerase IV subunit B
MSSELARPSADDARKIEVLTFAEAVRRRPHMYFGTDDRGSELAAAVVRQAAADAMNTPESTPAVAELLIHSDLRFTINDNIPILYSDVIQPPVPYWHWSKELINSSCRPGLAAAAALSSLAVVQVSSAGRSWRQEFISGTARAAPEDEGPADSPGTRVTFELDAAYFKAGTAIPRDTAELRAARYPWPRRPSQPLAGTLTITDLRSQAPAQSPDSS